MRKSVTTLLLCAALTAAMPAWALVQATLSQPAISQDQTVTLTLVSDGAVSGPPDLSALEQDFHIVHRRTSRSSRSFNGRSSQRTTVTLTLAPKRGGELTIPAVAFGGERSQPLQLSVAPAATPAPAPATRGFEPMPYPPFPLASPQQGFGQGFPPATPFPTPGDWGSGGIGMPDWTTPPQQEPGWQAQPESREETAPAVPVDEGAPYWPWITGLLLSGWILTTLVLWRRIARSPSASARTTSVTAEEEPNLQQQTAAALEEVRHAYQKADALAAKAALLHWAAIHWPGDPPTNLSRLAAHCPGTLQRNILKLDESLYSPEPVAWNEAPVWEQLRDLDTNQSEPTPQDAPPVHANS